MGSGETKTPATRMKNYEAAETRSGGADEPDLRPG